MRYLAPKGLSPGVADRLPWRSRKARAFSALTLSEHPIPDFLQKGSFFLALGVSDSQVFRLRLGAPVVMTGTTPAITPSKAAAGLSPYSELTAAKNYRY